MMSGPVSLGKLPEVNDIPIQNKDSGFYALEVMMEFSGMRSVSSQVSIGNNGQVYFPFFFFHALTVWLQRNGITITKSLPED
jgi:hypothetical protein